MPAQDNRLRELSLLAGGLAHEIRNPLSTVNLNLQLLEEDLGESGRDDDGIRRARNRLSKLRGEVHRLSDVLDDFLRFARMPLPERKPDDLNALIQDLVAFVQPEARGRNIAVMTNLGDLPACEIDRDMLRQALLNLLINAQHAMPDGGEIMIRSERADGEAVISVADTGAGMDDSVAERIFDPYFSTKREGNGLGLPTVKRIIEEHGGRIEVHTERNRGTCFTLRLPLAAQHADTP